MGKTVNGDELPRRKHAYGSFGDRWPDYVQWLDGQTWELTFQELGISKGTVNGFRSSLHYQAKQMRLNLVTKTLNRQTENGFVHVLLVRADAPQVPPEFRATPPTPETF